MKMSQTKFDKELEKALKNEALITFPDGCKYTGMTKKDPKNNRFLEHYQCDFETANID